VKQKHSAAPKTAGKLTASSPVVSAAHAKLKFADLLKIVESGGTVTIERYNKPIAKIVPAGNLPDREFGFFEGLTILDPDWDKKPTLTDDEIDQLSEANY
jgi:prevent-host-death family protein